MDQQGSIILLPKPIVLLEGETGVTNADESHPPPRQRYRPKQRIIPLREGFALLETQPRTGR